MALAPSLTTPLEHPGLTDPAYRARRSEIASIGETYRPGGAIPVVHYTPEEDDVWMVVSSELAAKHQRDAADAYLEGAEAVSLPSDQVPQLAWVSRRLTELTRFRIEPVPGLVPTRRFYGSLADRCFLSTQYVRHPAVPLYTPEPDVIHEVIGHANQLGHPLFADLYEAMGFAVRRVESNEALDRLSRVWWFTMEFGVVHERGDLKAYGAGILSSFGELDVYRDATIHPFDLRAMETQAYDITTFQPVLFAAESMQQVSDELRRYFERARG
ncbi:MAG TPA: phenylalanine 4-monooxygenase [Acidimicrobiales bacterium]|nr:phenylalanine 4-monooxygenase [Acidimicrobiales bacterium]